MKNPTLGHIDCPHCGASGMMRVTHDKNGKPFGHCDDCNGQLRVGGNSYREKKFLERFPWAGQQKAPEIPVTVTAPPAPEKPAVPAPAAPVTAPKQEQKQKAPADKFAAALAMLGGAR